jgi:hypothetical protein
LGFRLISRHVRLDEGFIGERRSPRAELGDEVIRRAFFDYTYHYTFSHYDYTISNGSIQYPEQTGSDLSRKYGPNEIVTFMVNRFPVIEKPLRVSITRLDLESSTNCYNDSVTFVEPATYDQTHWLKNRGIESSDYRWVVLSEKQPLCRMIYFKFTV